MTTRLRLCTTTLLPTGSCDVRDDEQHDAVEAFSINILVDCDDDPCEDCEGDYGDKYVTRFGDVCCKSCHRSLYWSGSLVRDGIYGDDTQAWTDRLFATYSAKADTPFL